jgi:hypothetical protein
MELHRRRTRFPIQERHGFFPPAMQGRDARLPQHANDCGNDCNVSRLCNNQMRAFRIQRSPGSNSKTRRSPCHRQPCFFPEGRSRSREGLHRPLWHRLTPAGTLQSENNEIDAHPADPRARAPIRPGVHPEPARNLDGRQPRLPHCGRLATLPWQMPQVPTTPPVPHRECRKELRKINEAFGLEFQQYCVRVAHFALPRKVDGTRNRHNRTPSLRRVVGENASGTVWTMH